MSEYPNITDETLIKAIREVASANAERVYTKPDDSVYCLYVHTDAGDLTPGCLIGHALHRLGVPLERMHGVTGNASDLMSALGIDVSNAVRHYAVDAQGCQDTRMTWSAAVRVADQGLSVRYPDVARKTAA